MKKVVVLSDTHGNVSDLDKIKNILFEADVVFHLGDGFNDLNFLGYDILKKTLRVSGNCDKCFGEREIVTEVEGVKILLTHGDLYGVKSGNTRLFYRAKELGVNAVFYGHTHAPIIETVEDITIANPGNLQKYSTKKTFIYGVFYDGKFTLTINENALV